MKRFKWPLWLIGVGLIMIGLGQISKAFAQTQPPEIIEPFNAKVSWEPPVQNVDGSDLPECDQSHEHQTPTDPDCLDGFKLHVGEASGDYDETIDIPEQWLRTYTYDGTARGEVEVYMVMTAYDSGGDESANSGEVSKVLTGEPVPTGDRPLIFIE